MSAANIRVAASALRRISLQAEKADTETLVGYPDSLPSLDELVVALQYWAQAAEDAEGSDR